MTIKQLISRLQKYSKSLKVLACDSRTGICQDFTITQFPVACDKKDVILLSTYFPLPDHLRR